MNIRLSPLGVAVLALAISACGSRPPAVTIFSAAVFEPALYALRNSAGMDPGLRILTETGSSGNMIRRVTELGRACDLMLLADPEYFKTLGEGRFSWRIDFAGDEMVLAVGIRAPLTDIAERNWPEALLDPRPRLARVDETTSPAGARTLLVWSRSEEDGHPGLREQLLARTVLVVDDVGTIAARLRAGDVDYAFLYRSSCMLHELRHIRLAPRLRLAEADDLHDPQAIRYALSIPYGAAHPCAAEALIRVLLDPALNFVADSGFIQYPPRFYGPRDAYARFRDITAYGGEF